MANINDTDKLKWLSINKIYHTKLTIVQHSDTHEYGIGDFSEKGMAWRCLIPEKLHKRVTLNLL